MLSVAVGGEPLELFTRRGADGAMLREQRHDIGIAHDSGILRELCSGIGDAYRAQALACAIGQATPAGVT